MPNRTASEISSSNVSRSKSHERLVAKWLTEWSKVQFRRRRVTGRDTSTKVLELTGDVISLERQFIYSVECKCGKSYSFEALLESPKTAKFTQWWHQANYDANLASEVTKHKIYPMLFFRPKNGLNWVAFSANSLSIMNANKRLPYEFNFVIYNNYLHIGPVSGNISHTKNKKFIDLMLDPVVLCRWSDFEKCVDPNSLFYE